MRKIDIVHCGIDLERFRFIERSMRQPAQKLRMLNVGRLVSQKAQDILIKALELVKFKKIPFTLEIIGGGPMEEELRNLTNKLNIANEVIFHGIQTEDFVRERLAAVDLFVLSSRSEGLPVVLMEAMAVGTPVIATKIFGIPELVNDGVSGLLVPPDDPHALAEAICSAYADPSLLCAMQFAGRRAVETSFERGACTLALTRIWNNALD